MAVQGLMQFRCQVPANRPRTAVLKPKCRPNYTCYDERAWKSNFPSMA